MPKKTWNEVKQELKDALDIAKHGHTTVPRGGVEGRIFGPGYKPNPPSGSDVEARLKTLHRLYESGQIDHEDFERRKAAILEEI